MAKVELSGRRRLVQEHQPIRIEFGLRREPRLAGRSYVRMLLLRCVRRPFF